MIPTHILKIPIVIFNCTIFCFHNSVILTVAILFCHGSVYNISIILFFKNITYLTVLRRTVSNYSEFLTSIGNYKCIPVILDRLIATV